MNDFQKRLENLSPKRLMLLALELQAQLEENERQRTEPIAVIGLGCRIPGAEAGPDAFWRLLEQAADVIREVPGDRWEAEAYYDANIDAPGRMNTKWGAFLSNIDQFDAPFFGIAGREANGMDPQHRILLEVCWEALEHAGHSPRKLGGTATGVYLGICASDYQDMLLARGEETIDAYVASGTSPSIAAGRISYTLGLQGPSLAVDTACSASLVAVHLACQSLRTGECRMALAAGVNAILSPDTTIALSKAHMMAPDGRCKTFDSRADGFVRAEGCGVVVLKKLSDAVADGDHIWALIRGSAVNQDGRSSGITAPNGPAQEAVIRTALEQAGVRPEEIGYVETHGTGTALGDPIEAQALAAVLGPGRNPENPLVVGSVKTNLGHLEGAAGIAGLIKVVLALQHERIPPHLHFERINPHIDWGSMPVEIPVAGRAWPRAEMRRVAGVSSFGFSGTNAHLIVEEGPEPQPRKRDHPERKQHLLAVSAKTEKALQQLGEQYASVLERGQVDLADLCYTANTGRAHFEQRLAVVGATSEEVRQRLLEALAGTTVRARDGLRVAFLFPGQAEHFAGMGRELFDTQPAFRTAIEECAEYLREYLGRPLQDVLWANAREQSDETTHATLGLFAVQWGLARVWQNWGIEPDMVVGHGVGNYVAACLAGVFSLAEGLKLVAARDPLEAAASQVKFAEPRLRVISGVTGRVVGRAEMSQADYWRPHATNPVKYRVAIESLREQGCDVILAMGPETPLHRAETGPLSLASLRPGQEGQQILESLGHLYVRGAEVNWAAFDKPYSRRRVTLPTYPFDRQRYWMDQPPSRRTTGSLVDVSDWFYEISWQPKASERGPNYSGNGAARERSGGGVQRWLIVSTASGVASDLVRRIRDLGGKAALAASPQEAAVQLRNDAYDSVVHLVSPLGASTQGEQAISIALRTAQAILAAESRAHFWLVTTGAQPVGSGQTDLELSQAPVWGFGKTFALEHPENWGGLVDLDPSVSASQSAAQLLSTIEKHNGEDQIAFRDGRRFVARLVRRAVPTTAGRSFSAGKTYLITGGLGGLGLTVAAWMASHGARNLVLVSRNAPSEQAAKAIEGLQRRGTRVEVHLADAASGHQLEAVFQKMQDSMPGLGGVVHAAGALDDGLIDQQTSDRVQKVMAPKVSGALTLHRLTSAMTLEFFVLFSSMASVVGSPGQSGYAAANAFLDALAHTRRAKGLPALSVNWGGWADVGMAARLVGQGRRPTDFQLMRPNSALAALGQVLWTDAAQVGIAAVDWSAYKNAPGRPFFESLPTRADAAASASKIERPPKDLLHEILSAPPAERRVKLVRHLLEALATILGVAATTIDPSEPITNFGLDSLMALEFRNRIDSELEVAIPTVRFLQGLSLADVACQIEAELPEAKLRESDSPSSGSVLEFPLSFGQQEGWFGHKMMPGTASFNVGVSARAHPCLDWPAFKRSVAKLTSRHAALRTVFFENDAGAPMQRILPAPPPDIDLIDAKSMSDDEIKNAILQDFGRPFELDRPVFRGSVFHRRDEDLFFLKFDHIILDHWSVRLCIEDLSKLYAAELAGNEPELEPIRAEYCKFVEWESTVLEGIESNQHWHYWKRELSGELPILRLPSSRQRPSVLMTHGGAIRLAFTSEHWPSVQRISREHQATGYSFLLAAFQVLLYRYTAQTDIIVGSSVSGRQDPRWANTMGLFVNLVALRGDLSGNPTFTGYLVRVRDTVWGALEHQEFPFSLLVPRLRQGRNLGRIPIFQSFFNFLTDRSGALRSIFMGVQDCAVEFGTSMLRPYMAVPQQEGRADVGIQLAEVDGQLVGYLNYNSAILDSPIAEAMAADYCKLLDAVLRQPNARIDDLLPTPPGETADREEIVL